MRTKRTNRPKPSVNSNESESEIVKRLKHLPLDVRKRSAEARKRLGVTAKSMETVRRIMPSLREAGLNMARVIETLEGDDSADAQIFLAKWRSIKKNDRTYLSIEEICVAAGLTTRRLWEVIAGARLEQSQDTVKLMVSDAQPRMVATTIRAATEHEPILDGNGRLVGYTNGCVKAQELMYKAIGFLPTPKGSTTTINLNSQGTPAPLPLDEGDPDDEQLEDIDQMLKDLQNTVAPKQLEAPRVTVPVIPDLEFEDIIIER
jgi:hypothetical protein